MGNLKKKVKYQTTGVKPTQEEFDAMDTKAKEALALQYPGLYKISADTPTKAELDAIVAAAKKKKSKLGKVRTGGLDPTLYKEGGVKKSTASEFLEPPSAYNLDS